MIEKGKKHRMKAFTLSEMIVVLLLTTIVVGLAFSVLGLVQRHMEAIRSNFNKNEEIQHLEQILWIDVNRYPNIRYSKVDNRLFFWSPLDTVTYDFTTDLIIRENDTLQIGISAKKFYRNTEEVSAGTIDAIELISDIRTLEQPIFVFRRNDATQPVNGF